MLTNSLHVYGPLWWHADSHIVGTDEALRGLRDAIDRALVDGAGYQDCFTNDGEGFTLHVLRVDESTFNRLSLPYTDESARDTNSGRVIPETLVPASSHYATRHSRDSGT